MKRGSCARLFRRMTASVALLAYLASCTHLPSGQKAFDSFDQCIAANLGLAAVGGVAIGALGKALTKQITGDKNTQNAVGVSAGVAAAVMIGLTAWRKCAAVYNTSEPSAQPASAPHRHRFRVRKRRVDGKPEVKRRTFHPNLPRGAGQDA
jgi:DMSO reductase anchor subunit